MQLVVIGGYLGAGKTTLLNHLLRNNPGYRLALLINDFGELNLDAQLVESRDQRQINLANGCVCCSLSDGFFEALETLAGLDPAPDHIVVEASGVADVHQLAQYGRGPGLSLAGVIVVADATGVRQRARDRYVGRTITRQLAAADLVVLSKPDLVDRADVQALTGWLAEHTRAPVLPATHGALPVEVLLGVQHRAHLAPDAGDAHHARYASWSCELAQVVDRAALEAFMARLDGAVLRAKGLFPQPGGGTLELQVVGRRRELRRANVPAPARGQLVAIGLEQALDVNRLDTLARDCFGALAGAVRSESGEVVAPVDVGQERIG